MDCTIHAKTLKLDTRMLVLMGIKPGDKERVVQALSNCIVQEGEKEGQLYFLPLNLWPAVVALFIAKSGRYNDPKLESYPLDGVELYVEGQRFAFADNCKACPSYMEKSLNLCRPLHVTCASLATPFSLAGSEETRLAWLKEHPLLEDRMPSDIPFKEASKLSTAGAFERLTLSGLSNEPAVWEEMFKKRSQISTDAAATCRHKDFACVGCMRGTKYTQWCSSHGGGGCKEGPYREEDYKHWSSSCEPWMAHVLLLSGHGYDMRKDVPSWRGSISGGFEVGYPVGESVNARKTEKGRFVRCFKIRGYSLEGATLPYSKVCERLGIKAVQTWTELHKTNSANGTVPEDDGVSRSLAYLLAAKSGGTFRQRFGYGWTDYYLYGAQRNHKGWRLSYRSDRGRSNYINVETLNDLFSLRQVDYEMARPTELRRRENTLLKKLIHEHRVPIGAKRWQALFLKKYRQVDPDPKELKRLVNSERRAARKRLIAARTAEAAKETPKHEPEPEVAVAPVEVGVTS
jgi:hypothetical protein